MQCVVDENEDEETRGNSNITFLYTLGPGAVPKSFGINVAKLAGLPDEVLSNAKKVSHEFEAEMTATGSTVQNSVISAMSDEEATAQVQTLLQLLEDGNFGGLQTVWEQLQGK
jgi:DNA mismatch repair ATPase MutS